MHAAPTCTSGLASEAAGRKPADGWDRGVVEGARHGGQPSRGGRVSVPGGRVRAGVRRPSGTLPGGVTVTHQVLVLGFLVRVQAG